MSTTWGLVIVGNIMVAALAFGLHQSGVQKQEQRRAEGKHLLECARYDPQCRATLVREIYALNLPDDVKKQLLAYVAYWEAENEKQALQKAAARAAVESVRRADLEAARRQAQYEQELRTIQFEEQMQEQRRIGDALKERNFLDQLYHMRR